MSTVFDNLFKSFPDWKPNVLMLGPGGAKGFQIIGALTKIYPEYISEVDTMIGCSVGSIICMMICLGYTPVEIAVEAFNFNLFDYFQLRSLSEIVNKKGLIDPETIKDKLLELVKKKSGGSNLTLQQLYNICGTEFISVVSYKDICKAEYVSHVNFPDEFVTDVVFASMKLPFIFHQTRFNGHIVVDGALTDPLPIHLRDFGNNRILVIAIDSQNTNDDVKDETGFITDIYESLILPVICLKKIAINNASERCKILDMVCKFVDTTGATLGREQKLQMLKDGLGQMETCLEKIIKEENNSKKELFCNYEPIVNTVSDTEQIKRLIVKKNNSKKRTVHVVKKIEEIKPEESIVIERTAQNQEAFDEVINNDV